MVSQSGGHGRGAGLPAATRLISDRLPQGFERSHQVVDGIFPCGRSAVALPVVGAFRIRAKSVDLCACPAFRVRREPRVIIARAIELAKG